MGKHDNQGRDLAAVKKHFDEEYMRHAEDNPDKMKQPGATRGL